MDIRQSLETMFGRGRLGRAPAQNWIAERDGVQFPIHRGKLFSCDIDGRTLRNSRFGDLRIQLEDDFGCIVRKVS